MMKVKGLINFGLWLKKDKIVEVNNNIGTWAVEQGYAEFVEYVDTGDGRIVSAREMNKRKKLFEKYNVPYKQHYSMKTILHLLELLERK